MTYKAVYNLGEVGVFETLYEAVKNLWQAVKEGMQEKTLSWQTLETACWIETDNKYLFNFYDARDYAFDAGWAKDSEWVGSPLWEN